MADTIKEFIFGLTWGKADPKPLKDAENDAEKSAGKVTKSWAKGAKSVGVAFAAIGAAAVGAGTAMFTLANKSTKAADEIAKGARNIGVTTREYQRLSHAAGLAGVDFNVLAKSTQNLNRDIARGANAPKEFTDALRDVGLSLAELSGSAEENMGKVLDALNAVEDEGKRSGLSLLLLGKAGRQMGTLIAGGSAGLRVAGDELERLGLLTDEELTASESFQDSLTRMNTTLGVTAQKIGISLAPELERVVDETTEWAAANREVLAEDLSQFAGGLASALTSLLPLITQVAGAIGDLAQEWGDLIEGIQLSQEELAKNKNKEDEGIFSLKGAGAGAAAGSAFLGVGAIPGAIIGGFAGQEVTERAGAAGNIRVEKGFQANLRRRNKKLREDQERAQSDAARAEARAAAGEESRGRAEARAKLAAMGVEFNQLTGRWEKKRKKRAGGGGKRTQEVISAESIEADELFGDELRRLAKGAGAGETQIAAAIEAGGRSLASGALPEVARQAARSRLGSLTGQDFSTRGRDPMLSEIFGEDVPDVAMSTLAMGATPQTLIATINNNYTISMPQTINEAGDAQETAAAVRDEVRNVFVELEKTTKLSAVPFAR